MSIRQSNIFGSNNITTHSGGGLGGGVLAIGAAAAMVAFAMTVAVVIGGAVALAVLVLACTGAGCLVLSSVTRNVLHVAHWRATRQLPPSTPLVTINRPVYSELPPVQHPRMTVTNADYTDGAYPGERDHPW